MIVLSAYFLVYRCSLLTALIFLFLLIRLLHQYGKKISLKVLPVILAFLVIFSGHTFLVKFHENQTPSQVSQLVPLPDSIQVKGDSLSFQAKSAGRKYQVFYKLESQEEQTYFQNLQDLVTLTVQAEVSKPDGPRNFNGFDYQAYLRTKGIYESIKIEEIRDISPHSSWNPMDWLLLGRRRALLHISKSFPAPMYHYMTGLLFGDLDTNFEEMEDVYSSLGIIHLFALSGMQVGFFIDKIRYLLLRFGLKRETVDKIQVPFSVVYAAMTGLSVSVVRSLIQKILGNMGLRGLDNMAVTLAVTYLFMPHFLLTAGGQLSFAYAFLLSVFDFEKLPAFKKVLVESLAISVGILPILIFYFYAFQPLSILLTFAFSIIFDIILLPLLSILFLLSPFLAVSQVNFFFIWLENIILWIEKHSFLPLVFGKPESLILLLLFLILALIYDFFHRRKIMLSLSCLALICLFFTKQPLTNEVTVVDIGQGDSILLRDFSGKTILIDVGGRVDFAAKEKWQERRREANASRTLIPYLKSRGISKIDQLLLTHTDTDHIGDMEVVAQNLKIGQVLVSPGSLTDADFVRRLKAMKVNVKVVWAGDQLSIMNSRLHVLYPFEKGDGGNDDSIVLYGKLLNKNFLFTGDLEETGEGKILASYPNLPVDILKAGHHGSKGSSSEAFLDHVQPELALLSAGKNNRYKHPHRETLDRFAQRNIASLRTDQHGAIRFLGWKEWKVETVK